MEYKPPGQPRKRYKALDGLRGVAAVIVLALHTGESDTTLHWLFPHGYLAVDLFFMISGFVIGSAYENRLRGSDWPVLEMLRVRLLRVYPLIALGGILGAVAAAMGIGDAPHGVPILLLKHLVLWPSVHGFLYPLDPVAWSLFFELIANVAHAVLLRWLSVRNLMLSLIVSLIALTGAAIHRGHLNAGFGLADITVATARVAFSYTAGLILFRLQQMGALPLPRLPGVLLALALPIALMFPDDLLRYGSLHGARSENLIKDLGCVVILFPALVSLAACAEVRGATAWGAKMLGELSYPIYSIQIPLLVVFSIEIAPRLSAYPPLVVWGLFMVGVATLSWVALEYLTNRCVAGWVRAFPHR